MKKKVNRTINETRAIVALLITTILFAVSCGKDGSMGPQGPKGDTGETGAIGPQGIPGKDGAVIHFGNGAPATNMGNNGDMYLDRQNSNLYGPKVTAGWGTPLNLRGATGAKGDKGDTGATGARGAAGAKGDKGDAGTPGSKFLSGTANPSTGTGAVGDFYLNKTSGDLFGPKVASGWGTPINLKGTANVVASTWIDLIPWTNTTVSYIREARYDIPAPILNAVGYSSLTSMTASGGVLLVYLSTNGAWTNQLPYTNITSNWHIRWYLPNNEGFNFFYLNVRRLSGTTALPEDIRDLTGNYKLRYVLIPAGLQLSAKGRDLLDIKALQEMSYEDAQALLGLED